MGQLGWANWDGPRPGVGQAIADGADRVSDRPPRLGWSDVADPGFPKSLTKESLLRIRVPTALAKAVYALALKWCTP
jgi:hypothetical protein